MLIYRTREPLFGINSYFILEGDHTIAIDPSPTAESMSYMEQHPCELVILTHEHFDHIHGVNAIKSRWDVRVVCGEKALNGLGDPSVNLSPYTDILGESCPFGSAVVAPQEYRCQADGTLADMERVQWRGHELLIKETPGHSKGSISILLDQRFLFSGDTVFKEYRTATRMPGGSTRVFKAITEPWLDSLPKETIVYPGHGECFALGERFIN